MEEHIHGDDEEYVEVHYLYLDKFRSELVKWQTRRTRAMLSEAFVAYTLAKGENFKVVIYPNDHAPPHFHVIKNNESPAFSIETGDRLPGHKGLKNKDKQIKQFWHHGRYEILAHWNKYRPDDQPHQKMKVPNSWPSKDELEESFSFDGGQLNEWIY